jgi:hypothetical protein
MAKVAAAAELVKRGVEPLPEGKQKCFDAVKVSFKVPEL